MNKLSLILFLILASSTQSFCSDLFPKEYWLQEKSFSLEELAIYVNESFENLSLKGMMPNEIGDRIRRSPKAERFKLHLAAQFDTLVRKAEHDWTANPSLLNDAKQRLRQRLAAIGKGYVRTSDGGESYRNGLCGFVLGQITGWK